MTRCVTWAKCTHRCLEFSGPPDQNGDPRACISRRGSSRPKRPLALAHCTVCRLESILAGHDACIPPEWHIGLFSACKCKCVWPLLGVWPPRLVFGVHIPTARKQPSGGIASNRLCVQHVAYSGSQLQGSHVSRFQGVAGEVRAPAIQFREYHFCKRAIAWRCAPPRPLGNVVHFSLTAFPALITLGIQRRSAQGS